MTIDLFGRKKRNFSSGFYFTGKKGEKDFHKFLALNRLIFQFQLFAESIK